VIGVELGLERDSVNVAESPSVTDTSLIVIDGVMEVSSSSQSLFPFGSV